MPSVAFAATDMMSFFDSTEDSVRKLTDDLNRHRLTDVLEEDNEDDGFGRYANHNNNINRKRYSSIGSTASSIDALWETHPRRLSEAGLSRHSDSSTILTEDTDSFIIGQRVWVSGNKPGHIAYIGETQFAPGDWAGIALDEAIGKNDGSVGGIRYFQCEPKKGVFSRLTRLTRFPLEGMGSGETYGASTPSPVGNGVRRSPISPTGSTKGSLRSPMSVGGSNTSLASAQSHVVDYKIGDRVIIKSSQGSKVGTVKYIGMTEFANGEWVGVELDDPRGKNDGSVNGKRYFECRPNFGLFAPVSKVSKSPSRVKPGNCQVHPGGQTGLPPSGIRRANSKESITSNLSMSSAASGARRVRLGVTSLAPRKSPIKTATTTTISTRTALQDLVKEKQQHIEQLLRERDLEIAEVTKAASRADDAEQKLAILDAEFEKCRADCEREKRKNEDLQFRLDEASITKDDIEVTNANNVTKLRELEEQLVKERDKCDKLEIEANKLFEAEEELIKARDEIKILKEQVEESRNKELALQGDNASTAVLISSLQKEVDQYKSDLSEKEEMIRVLKQEITANALEMNKQLNDISNKKTELETLCNSKDSEITVIKKELEQANVLMKDKIDAIDKITTEKLSAETNLEKQVEKLKMELSSKILDLENATDLSRSKTEEVTKLSTDMESLRDQLNKTVGEYEEKIKDLTNQIQERNNKFEEINITNNQYLDEIKTVKNELDTLKKISDDNVESLKTYTQTLEEKELKLAQVTKDLQLKDEELTKMQETQNNLRNEYEIKITEVDNLKSDIENIRTEYQNTLNIKNTEFEKTINDIKEKELLIQNLQTELQTTKVDLESVTNNLLQYQNNLSTVEESLKTERDEIKESLKAKIVELEDLKAEFSSNLAQREKLVEDTRLELHKIAEERTKLQQEFDSFKSSQDLIINNLKVSHGKEMAEKEDKLNLLSSEIVTKSEEIVKLTTASKQLEEYNGKLALEIEQLHKELETKSKSLDNESEVISKLNEQIEHLTKDKEQQLARHDELEELKNNLQSNKASLEADIANKNEEIVLMNNKLVEKNTQLTNIEAELKATKENLERNASDNETRLEKEKSEIKALLESQTSDFETIKKELSTKIEQTETLLLEANKTIADKNEEVEKLNQQMVAIKAEKETFIKEITEDHNKKYGDLEIKVSDLLTEIENKNSKIADLTRFIDDLEAGKSKHVQELEKIQIDLETALKQNMNESETIMRMNEEIKYLTTTKDDLLNQLTENQNQLKEVSLHKDQLTSESQLLSTTSNEAQTKLTELYKQMEQTNTIHQTLKNEFEAKTQKLESTVQELQVSNKQLQDIMEKQAIEHETKLNAYIESEKQLKNLVMSNNDEKLKDLQQILDTTVGKLAEKEKLLELQNNEITKLKEEVVKGQSKGSVNGATTVANISAEPNAATTTNSKTDYQQLLEDKVFAENQIQFLNSIIVDMQKKNEEQKARIEILEMGYNSAAADELAMLGFKSEIKQPAPRMYCDICEEFDLHETEDCPTQGEDEQVLPRHSDKPKEKPPARPYCELCGVFGHDTADCTEDQEF